MPGPGTTFSDSPSVKMIGESELTGAEDPSDSMMEGWGSGAARWRPFVHIKWATFAKTLPEGPKQTTGGTVTYMPYITCYDDLERITWLGSDGGVFETRPDHKAEGALWQDQGPSQGLPSLRPRPSRFPFQNLGVRVCSMSMLNLKPIGGLR